MAAGGSVKLCQLLRDFGWSEDEPGFFPDASLAGPTLGERKLLAWEAASGAAIDTNAKGERRDRSNEVRVQGAL